MSFISVFRLVTLSLSLFLGLVILGLTAHWTQGSLASRVLYDFEIVALVAGAVTALTLPVMIVVDLIRRGAITSMIAVEIPTLTVLWVLFLVLSALTAQWKDLFYPFGCGDTFDLDVIQQGWCREFFAIFGLSFVVWIFLFLYTVTLLVFALISQSRGNTVWRSSVSEANFFPMKPAQVQLQPGATVYHDTGAYPPPSAMQQFPRVSPMQQVPTVPQYTVGLAPLYNNGLPQV